MGEGDARSLCAVQRQKARVHTIRGTAKTSTHTYTQVGGMCVCGTKNVYVLGLEGHAEGSIVTIGQHGGNSEPTSLSGLHFV